MSNLKTKYILGWMLFCMFMPIIPIAGIFGFDEYSHKSGDYLVLILLLISYAGLLAIPLSLLNLFLFKRNLSIKAAKRIATIPLGLCIVCSTILLMYSIVVFHHGNSSAIITLAVTLAQLLVTIIAISWFRNKIEELYTHLRTEV